VISYSILVATEEKVEKIKGEPDDILAAANYVENEDMTPFDALHLVKSGDEVIISSDDSYDDFSDRIELDPDR
ncbi:MAG: hypothetical protein ACLFSM_08270, partial [Thermoplasmata archaeon]